MRHERHQRERGFILVAVLFLTVLAMLAMVGVLHQTRDSLAFEGASKTLLERDYLTEKTLNRAINWFNNNSATIAEIFNASDFYTYFERTSATVGDNDSTSLGLPTRIKLRGSSDSFMLTSSPELGSEAVINTVPATNLADSFNTEFTTSEYIRITLLDVSTESPADDGGDPLSGGTGLADTPVPLFRIDVYPNSEAVTGSYSLVRGTPE